MNPNSNQIVKHSQQTFEGGIIMSKKVAAVTDKQQETGEDYSQKRDKEFKKSWEIRKEMDRLLREAHKSLSEANALMTEHQALLTSCYSYLPSVMTDYGCGDHLLFKPFDSILEAALARVDHLGSDLFAHQYTPMPDKEVWTDAEKDEYLQDRVHNRSEWLNPKLSCD
jgi:hypothetical protein